MSRKKLINFPLLLLPFLFLFLFTARTPDSPEDGKRFVFKFKKANFSLEIPPPLVMEDKSPLKDLDPQARAQYEKMTENLPSQPSSKLEDRNFQISAEMTASDFEVRKRYSLDTTILCENKKQPRYPLEVGAEWWQLGSLKGCAKFTWEYEHDSPTNTKEDLTGEVIVTLNYKKVQYQLVIGVRNLDQHEVKDMVMAMAKSLRLEGEENVKPPAGGECRLAHDKAAAAGISLGLTGPAQMSVRRDEFIVLQALDILIIMRLPLHVAPLAEKLHIQAFAASWSRGSGNCKHAWPAASSYQPEKAMSFQPFGAWLSGLQFAMENTCTKNRKK